MVALGNLVRYRLSSSHTAAFLKPDRQLCTYDVWRRKEPHNRQERIAGPEIRNDPDNWSKGPGLTPDLPSGTAGSTWPQTQRVFGFDLSSGPVFALDGLIDLSAMDRDFCWSVDPQPDFVSSDIHDRDDNVVADDYAFITLSGQDKHP
jgi:hypothetical protein